jgi:hypothetical protein
MKKTETDDNPYLWDRSGEPDPEVLALETLLGQLRQQGAPAALPDRPRPGLRVSTWTMGVLSAAAAVLLIAAAGWFVLERARNGWSVQTIAGTPVIDGMRPGDGRSAADVRLGIGEWLVTDGISRARIAVGQIGRVDVEPNTRLQLIEARGREHRMALARGTIHARIWAPPKFFYVNTPSATAIDLGCEYTLQVDDSGAGLVRVTHGWVGFEGDGREAFIPEGAVGATRPGAGPGTPYYEDAPSGYGEALGTLDFGRLDDPQRGAAFELIVSSARRRDALTLWHLLSRGTTAERARVFDRLAALAPPPRAVTRAAVLAGNRRALDQWWDSLGIDDTTWWRLWKKKL